MSEPDAALVLECARRTLAADSARVEFVREFHWSRPPDSFPRRRRRGGLLRPVMKLLKVAIRALWRRWTHGMSFGRVAAEGIIEPAKRRYMLDYGEHAEVQVDGESRAGRSGDDTDTGGVFIGPASRDLWWLLEMLRGVTGVNADGDELVRGTSCRRLSASVDLSVASAASENGLRPPSVERFEELLALPLTVWVEGTYVRRVVFSESPGTSTLTLELWDFGVDTTGLDWSRLPTFRTGGSRP
jgi:hypothetical protein